MDTSRPDPQTSGAHNSNSHEVHAAPQPPPPRPPTPQQAPMQPPVYKTTTVEDDRESHIPYVAPLSSTSANVNLPMGPPVISTLPPIATARPLGNANAFNNSGNGNIPVVNGMRQTPYGVTNPQYPPTIVNLSAAPSAAAPHMLPVDILAPSPPFFEYMEQCRYTAGFMLCYYLCTFFFLQPFFVGIMGVLTGFLGYYGSRAPIFAAHIKWVRGYLWMNCAMVAMNIWYFAITMFFLSMDHSSDSSDDDDARSTASYRFDEQHLGLFITVIVALNLVLHIRGTRTARRFHAEMLRAGPLPGMRTVIVLGNPV